MFEKLSLLNFQSHRKLSIDFDPHITCFTGASDVGKSAIVRALRWICFNEPSGTDFIRHGKETAVAKLTVDGHVIARRRGKVNTYSLDGKVYKAFGSDVPPDIEQVLNLKQENFQQQHDAPFWFSQTPGQVSRELNTIINLDAIDTVLAVAAARVRACDGAVDTALAGLDAATGQREALAWAVAADRDLEKLEVIEVEANALQDTINRLKNLFTTIDEATKHLDRVALAAAAGGVLMKLYDKIRERNGEAKPIGDLIKECTRLRQELKSCQKELSEAELKMEKLMGAACPVCGRAKTKS